MKARRQWDGICKDVKEGKELSSRNYVSGKLSFKTKLQLRQFLVKQKLIEFTTSRLAYKKCKRLSGWNKRILDGSYKPLEKKRTLVKITI